jgi:hypothetical protein
MIPFDTLVSGFGSKKTDTRTDRRYQKVSKGIKCITYCHSGIKRKEFLISVPQKPFLHLLTEN